MGRTHDGNGNLKDDGSQVHGYDFENRLVEVRQSGTQALIATYQYDAIGRRVQKVVAGGSTTRYVLDGVEVVEEFDASGVWQARYVYEDGIDRPRCMDRADIADVNGNSNTTEVLRFHYHQQALGSVTEITQPTGAVVEWVTYDAYGQATIRDRNGTVVSQSAVGNPYLFTGREYDPESGLYHYRARGYDASTGRFLQRDPLGYADGLAQHEYVRSNPTSLADPLGEHVGWAPPGSDTRTKVIPFEPVKTEREDGGRTGGDERAEERLKNVEAALRQYNEENPDEQIDEATIEMILEHFGEGGAGGLAVPIWIVKKEWEWDRDCVRWTARPALLRQFVIYEAGDWDALVHEMGHVGDSEDIEADGVGAASGTLPPQTPESEIGRVATEAAKKADEERSRAEDAAANKLHKEKGEYGHEPDSRTMKKMREVGVAS